MSDTPSCAYVAAEYYHVPLTVIERVHAHAAGTNHIGPMGIHAEWLPILERIGFPRMAVESDVCVNIAAGAWILAWSGAGNETKTHQMPPPSSALTGSLKACANSAARRYHVPEVLYLALLATEGGQVGREHRNANGSFDLGPAQINTIHLPELARLGITRAQIVNDGCLNLQIGAWLLARELDGHGPDDPAEFWRRVGNYNSRTPEINQKYQKRVWMNVTHSLRKPSGEL